MGRCDNCIHSEVCLFRPPEGDDPEMKRIVQENCEYFISDRKIIDPNTLIKNLDGDIAAYHYNGRDLDVRKWLVEYLKQYKEV